MPPTEQFCYTRFFSWCPDALAEQLNLQREYCTWMEHVTGQGWRVRYCKPQTYLAADRSNAPDTICELSVPSLEKEKMR